MVVIEPVAGGPGGGWASVGKGVNTMASLHTNFGNIYLGLFHGGGTDPGVTMWS